MKILHKTVFATALLAFPLAAVHAQDDGAAHRKWLEAQKIDIQPTLEISETEIPMDSSTGYTQPGTTTPSNPGSNMPSSQVPSPSQPSGTYTPVMPSTNPPSTNMPGSRMPGQTSPGMNSGMGQQQ